MRVIISSLISAAALGDQAAGQRNASQTKFNTHAQHSMRPDTKAKGEHIPKVPAKHVIFHLCEGVAVGQLVSSPVAQS
jgi:hypothetical protein